VTAIGLISITLEIFAALGVSISKLEPRDTVAGEADIVGRGPLKRYGGL
jgi:hypothetical protein